MATTANHSSYHHLSPLQIRQLCFSVLIRCVRNGQPDESDNDIRNENSNSCIGEATSTAACGPLISRQVQWQEKIDRPNFHQSVDAQAPIAIFTYTHGDDVCCRGEPRLLRENPCETMMIMAAVQNESEEIALCTIKVHKNGIVKSTPGFSVTEAEEYDSGLFMSKRGFEEAITSGKRISAYTFQTHDGSVYEYCIESNEQQRTHEIDNDQFIASQMELDREIIDSWRELIRKDYEDSGRLYEESCCSTSQACVEVITATGFHHENMLLSTPFGSNLTIRYQLKVVNDGCKNTLMKGHTNVVQSIALIHSSIEFMVQFILAFVVVCFVASFVFGGFRIDCSTIVLCVIPLILMLKQAARGVDVIYNFNHQFSFNNTRNESSEHERIVLELSAFNLHNFGVTALAGYGIVDVPTEPGKYYVDVIAWKPLARTSIGEKRCQLHSYYLGACLEKIGPCESVQSPKKLFSTNDLHTTVSGTVKIRIEVTDDHFSRKKFDANSVRGDGAPNGYIRETVDEVLTRVRRNKRGRIMSEDRAGDRLLKDAGNVATDLQGNLSDRAASVLEKVRSSRQGLTNQA